MAKKSKNKEQKVMAIFYTEEFPEEEIDEKLNEFDTWEEFCDWLEEEGLDSALVMSQYLDNNVECKSFDEIPESLQDDLYASLYKEGHCKDDWTIERLFIPASLR